MRTTTIVKKTARLRNIVILAVLAAMIASSAEGYCVTVSPACHDGNGGNIASITYYPALTGPYKVGKTTFDWVDRSRLEPATNDKTYRELEVYVWYPAQPKKGAGEDMLMDEAMSEAFYYPNGTTTDDHTYADAPVANGGPYPVILASPADDDTPIWQTSIATQLASHGYIVVGISDPYDAYLTEFSDGRSVTQDLNYSTDSIFMNMAGLTDSEFIVQCTERGASIVERRTADTEFVLGQLQKLNAQNGAFRGKLNLREIGMFGHSIGGATAVNVGMTDSRVKAVANLDGGVWENISPSGVGKPVLTMNSDYIVLSPDFLALINRTQAQYENLLNIMEVEKYMVYRNSSTAYNITVHGAAHYNFADPGLLGLQAYSPGPIDGKYAMKINNAYIQAFFDKYLKGVDSPLLHGAKVYPQVTFEGHVNGRPIK